MKSLQNLCSYGLWDGGSRDQRLRGTLHIYGNLASLIVMLIAVLQAWGQGDGLDFDSVMSWQGRLQHLLEKHGGGSPHGGLPALMKDGR